MSKTLSLAASLFFALPLAANAHSFTKGDITVTHPWTKVTPGGASVGAGYAKITNKGKQADTLIGGSFDGATGIEVHEMKMDGNIMKMRRLENGLEIPAGATVELKPGANHLMFVGLKKPIAKGADVNGTLKFKNAGDVPVEFRVEPLGAMKSTDMKGMDKMQGHEHHAH